MNLVILRVIILTMNFNIKKMKTIKIDIPKGHKASFDEKKGEINFIVITNPRERFNVFDDILKFHELTQLDFNVWCDDLRPHEIGSREVELIIAAYNGRKLDDPLPEYGDGTGTKGYPLFNMPSPSGVGFSCDDCDLWLTISTVGARFVFFGEEWRENLIDCMSKFLPNFEKMYTL